MSVNVAHRLSQVAREAPERIAIAAARAGRREYRSITFERLDCSSDAIAQGLLAWGVRPGMRLVLLVPFGIDFIRLVFGILKTGAVVVLVDPGMGRRNLVACLEEADPDGFVAIPSAQLVRRLLRGRFPRAQWNVRVGGRLPLGGVRLEEIERRGAVASQPLPTPVPEDPAAVIFTTGSTGPPKGVLYTHDVFNHQVDLIQQRYQIHAGERDLACFPLFGLFDAVMGLTTVIPEMDPTRPADADPRKIIQACHDWEVTQAFGSPALWNTVVRHCQSSGATMPTLRRVLSAGAPVPPRVLEGLRRVIHPEGEVHTPYGATEALPIASTESREVLQETAAASRRGAGTCIGSRFPAIDWKVIRISDGPLTSIDQIEELARGEIGELMVHGPVVTDRYVTRLDQNALHKVSDGKRVWHRMGDLGYLDAQDRFWFCGRKSHRVVTATGTLYTVPCEAIANEHPAVYRSALVGVGERPTQHPVLVVEPWPEHRPRSAAAQRQLLGELRELAAQQAHTQAIEDIRIYPRRLPVDIRHNSKIFREQLARWAATAGK